MYKYLTILLYTLYFGFFTENYTPYTKEWREYDLHGICSSQKIEYSYFHVYVFYTSLLCIFVLPYGVLKTFHLKHCNLLI
jgi:hypothetical protein